MWKRWTTWTTLALLVWFNFVAWSIRTSPKQYAGVITLREHQVQAQGQAQAVTEYTTLAPSYFVGPTWFSYVLALVIGFGLPFILPRLVPWLWRRGKPLVQRLRGTPAGRKIAVRLALLVICNVLAWNIVSLRFEDETVLPLYHRQVGDTVWYTYLLPAVGFHSVGVSYALAAFFGFGLPFLLPRLTAWLWRRRPWRQPGSTGVARRPMGGSKTGAAVALLALLVVCNVVAWDWVNSDERDGGFIVLSKKETDSDWSSRRTVVYSGIAPSVVVENLPVSLALSFFVGEVLPFLLLPALRRRRPPPTLPLPPVAGAPR